MINWLESIDRSLLLFINGLHTPFLDEIMWFFSGKLSLTPLYLILLFLIKKEYSWRNFGLICFGVFLTILVADQTSVHLFKEFFQRYRPSHNLEICNKLHFYETKPGEFYRGGTYGFISSHAANYFGMVGFILPLFSKKYNWLKVFILFVGIIVGLSRVYLGVHYPSDVFLGAVIGLLIGWSIYYFLYRRYKFENV
jgi:undecaprenyl-diphosphatase